MSLFKTQQSNLESVITALLKKLGIKVCAETVAHTLKNHPDYPSLLSISDGLNEWQVNNQSYNIARADYNVDDLLFPFLAHLSEEGGRFILINGIDKGIVNYTDEKNKQAKITEAEFLNRWDGIALHAEKTVNSGEKNYKQNYVKYLLQNLVIPIGTVLVLITLYISFTANAFSWPYLILSVLKFLGLSIGILLLMQSINANNPLIKNLCGLGKKNDCNAILKSEAAKITSWLSWSEVGFFYFAGSLLSLLFAPSSLFLLAWANVFTLPYAVYSITYQYRAKNWCILCCAVQVLLVLEFVTALSFNLISTSASASASASISTLTSTLLFFLPIITWSFLKPFFLNAAQVAPLKKQLQRFKYNGVLFNQALTNQACYAIDETLLPVIFGNPDAGTIITMVSNPFCGPCGKAHETLAEWLKQRDDLQLKIIFTTANDDADQRTKVARHITALAVLKDKTIVKNALSKWYKQSAKNYETWATEYPIHFNGEMDAVTQKQKEWCAMAEITFTPTILINGYKLPEPYTLDDLKYLVE